MWKWSYIYIYNNISYLKNHYIEFMFKKYALKLQKRKHNVLLPAPFCFSNLHFYFIHPVYGIPQI